ncbi:MAG: DNA repair protein RecN [candidate division WOR-3 bacterium]|nr:DNA repair protein RecN [candidate division WOR-3 bacterium]MDW8149962.1 DNA repair protein RecN [candidate division WOR-3 bacterium]
MILNLKVKNFLLLKEAHIEFDKGFNVLTGETGAGKSLLLKALSLALGDRIDWEIFTEEKSLIEVQVLVPDEFLSLFENYGIELDGNLLIIRRIIEGDKRRSRIYANDNLVLSKTINEIIRNLIEIHGQYDTYKLFNEEYQMEVIDRYAKSRVFENDYQANILDKYANNENLIESYRKIYKDWLYLNNIYNEYKEKEEKYIQELEFLKYQLNELEEANLKINEEQELLRKLEYLRKIEEIREIKQLIKNIVFEGEENVISKLYFILRKLENLEDIQEFRELKEKFENIIYELKELKHYYKDNNLEEYESLDFIQERLFLLNRLKKKYSKSIEELLNYKEELKEKIKKIENLPFEIKNLSEKIKDLSKNLENLANEISKRRKNASKNFREEIIKTLKELGMPDAEFLTKFEEIPLGYNGKDRVEFLFSANKNFPPRPLRKIVSGGELSRFALSLKLAIAGKESPTTLIFDEIDTGIGGETALKVAQKLQELSKFYQVIVITHLPQIASKSNKHFLIMKKDGIAQINELDEKERVLEIARMLSGIVSDESLKHAKFLLSNRSAL